MNEYKMKTVEKQKGSNKSMNFTKDYHQKKKRKRKKGLIRL